MLIGFLKTIARGLLRNRAVLLINVSGLGLGLMCSILILLFVRDELSFDRFHADAEHIYRLRVERFSAGAPEFSAAASAPMMPAALNDLPQIEAGTRLFLNPVAVTHDDVTVFEDGVMFADDSFFDVFSFSLLSGDPRRALLDPNSMVLTESAARRYFDSEPAVGQLLEVSGRDMTVQAVVADPPSQSHFDFDMLVSFATLEAIQGPSTNWGWWDLRYHTYLKLAPGADVEGAAELVREMPSRYVGDEEEGSGYRQFLYLQPLDSIHLNSNYRFELGNNSSVLTVAVFAAVGVFILLIACINFINLSTARASERAREVGLRKTLGADARHLIARFLTESVLVALVAFVLALLAIQLLLPLFNSLAQKSLALDWLAQWPMLLGLLSGAIGVGMLAGLYPALVLSRFAPNEALNEQRSSQGGRAWLRQGLVVLQFTISVVLIIGSLIAQRQLGYMLASDMGFDKEQMLVVNARNTDALEGELESLRTELLALPGVQRVTASLSVPGRPMPTNVADLLRGQGETGQTFFFLPVDHDFIETYDLELIAGRGFGREFEADASGSFVINEAAYRALGWTAPQQAIGQELTRQFSDSRDIVGVMRDFNYRSLQFTVEPLVLYIRPDSYDFLSVKMSGDDNRSTIASIEETWRQFAPGQPFDYFLLQNDFDQQYHLELQVSRLLRSFTTLAILIACMGLYALAAFMTNKRRKELGIRKVLGATAARLVLLLLQAFTRPVVMATLLAIPISWYLAGQWLNDFANRIDMGWDVFFIASVLALLIAMITVAGHALRAALSNPLRSIRVD